MSTAPRFRPVPVPRNREAQSAYDAGFERGNRTGVATDRLYFYIFGVFSGVALMLAIRFL